MKQQVRTNNFLGREYTFYLSNYNLPNDSFYLYRLYSPGLMKGTTTPLFSLEKIGERTKPGQGYDQDRDLLSYVMGGKEGIDQKGIEWIKNAVRNENAMVLNDGAKFPRLPLEFARDNQKNLVCSLRDTIRWKYYRFFVGRRVDILWTPTEFVVFEFKGDDTNLWLEPCGVYKNNDYLMQNPLPVDLKTIKCDGFRWEKGKTSDINQTIRRIEWNSFDSKFRFAR